MIASLTGKLEARTADWAILNVGGVGFKVSAPAGTLAAMGEIGATARLLTLLYVRQDTLALYGFATPEELHMFELLLTISGIGPKAGIAILSSAPLNVLQVAIATGDPTPLTKIPGVGKKIAARIVLELKGKLGPVELAAPAALSSVADAEIVAALTTLGYNSADAQAALRAIPADTDDSIEARLTAALRFFASR